MALMEAILSDLREEIVERIYGVTLQVKPDEKWNCHEPTSATAFEEETGNTRTFKVGWFRPNRLGVGTNVAVRASDTRAYEINGAIRIHYGKTDEDHTAAAVDADLISRALIDNTPTATGVDYYCVPTFGEFAIEDTGEGDGILSTIPLFAVIETTES